MYYMDQLPIFKIKGSNYPCGKSRNAQFIHAFENLYPTTRVIINATEIFVETPSLPEFQQMTFSSYKNHNTYKSSSYRDISGWCYNLYFKTVSGINIRQTTHSKEWIARISRGGRFCNGRPWLWYSGRPYPSRS